MDDISAKDLLQKLLSSGADAQTCIVETFLQKLRAQSLEVEEENESQRSKLFDVSFRSLFATLVTEVVKVDSKAAVMCIDLLKPLFCFEDVKAEVLYAVDQYLKANEIAMWADEVSTVHRLIVSIASPVRAKRHFLCSFKGLRRGVLKKRYQYRKLRNLYSEVWLQFLKLKLPVSVHKDVLTYLPDKVMPALREPVLLADFFSYSYKIGSPQDDVYNPDEEDTAKCRANESSVWELKALEAHYYADVSQLAGSFFKALPSIEEPFVCQSMDKLLERDLSIELSMEVPLNHVAPYGLFHSSVLPFNEMWTS